MIARKPQLTKLDRNGTLKPEVFVQREKEKGMWNLREILGYLGITVTTVEHKYVFWFLALLVIIGLVTIIRATKYFYRRYKIKKLVIMEIVNIFAKAEERKKVREDYKNLMTKGEESGKIVQ